MMIISLSLSVKVESKESISCFKDLLITSSSGPSCSSSIKSPTFESEISPFVATGASNETISLETAKRSLTRSASSPLSSAISSIETSVEPDS